ncbi:LytR/AlgR family response regulator transcription factor [Sphingomonas soli]|uniref:LytR/AlgR family response regulator transcription factor n=1 Tax=Sphingomonas soli TaxID=266127 RepID=UPI00082CB9D8|nr:response regulator transcription factor [Sphingomonas soli]
MRIIIADDEPLARELLRGLLAGRADVVIVGEAADGEELVRMARETAADLILTDIDMPGLDGLGAAFALAHLGGPDVIFVTAYDRHATIAFDLDAIDYVLKPVRRHRLDQALNRALRRFEAKAALAPAGMTGPVPPADDDCLWVDTRKRLVRVELAGIDRVEAAGDHLYLNCGEQTYLHRMTMKEFEAVAARAGLRRVHRSAFVRMRLVRSIDRHGRGISLTLIDGTVVPVGPNYRAALDDLHPYGAQ